MANLCIIPARGGSKRIPKKNIKNFFGKPIIAYSIEAAINSNLFDEVMVSTDNIEISKIAKKYGAKVPFMRSLKNADDHASTFQVLNEVIERYKENNKTFINVCCIYPCAPFVTIKLLREAKEILIEEMKTSVFPVVKFGTPIQRALLLKNNNIQVVFPDNIIKRSQDIEESYYDAGQFYWANINKMLGAKSIITNNSGAIQISEMANQDIDTLEDWKIAELKYKLLQDV